LALIENLQRENLNYLEEAEDTAISSMNTALPRRNLPAK